jgi:hypothetical protein
MFIVVYVDKKERACPALFVLRKTTTALSSESMIFSICYAFVPIH